MSERLNRGNCRNSESRHHRSNKAGNVDQSWIRKGGVLAINLHKPNSAKKIIATICATGETAAPCHTRKIPRTTNSPDKTEATAEMDMDGVQSKRTTRKRKMDEIESTANEPATKRPRMESTVKKDRGEPNVRSMDTNLDSIDSNISFCTETAIELQATPNFGKKSRRFELTVQSFADALPTLQFNPYSADSWKALTKCFFKAHRSKIQFSNKVRAVKKFWDENLSEIKKLLRLKELTSSEFSNLPAIESTAKTPASVVAPVTRRTRTWDSIDRNTNVGVDIASTCKATPNIRKKSRCPVELTVQSFADALSTLQFNPNSADSWKSLTKCFFRAHRSKVQFSIKVKRMKAFWERNSSEITKLLPLNELKSTECPNFPEIGSTAKTPASVGAPVTRRTRSKSKVKNNRRGQEAASNMDNLERVGSNVRVFRETETEHKETPNASSNQHLFKVLLTVELFADALSAMEFNPRCADSWKALTKYFLKKAMTKQRFRTEIQLVKRFWEKNFSEITKLVSPIDLAQTECSTSPEVELSFSEITKLPSPEEPLTTQCPNLPNMKSTAKMSTDVDEVDEKTSRIEHTKEKPHDGEKTSNNLGSIDSNLIDSEVTSIERKEKPAGGKKWNNSRVLTVQLFVDALSSMPFNPCSTDSWRALTKRFFKANLSKRQFGNKIRLLKAFWAKHSAQITKLLRLNEPTTDECSNRPLGEPASTDAASVPHRNELDPTEVVVTKAPESEPEPIDDSKQVLIIVLQ